ncbi:MAG: relaxase/mobilization nuclease domain-containing protein [Synergistaceae bacterium]|nr:relaxase/mobilization nuclease domain-containing protein [Synergistaceae bacterium]
MIAKIPPKRRDGKSSFKALIDYCLGVTGHSAGSVLHVGAQELHSLTTAAVEMESVAFANGRCRDPVFHFILSWREREVPTKEQADAAAKIALAELDLQECQALWALQGDTENLHLHVAVNRIHPETFRAIQPAGNWTKKALERAARKIERAQGWEIERSGRYDVDDEGNIFERTERREPEVSQKARDIEAHTGAESLERMAKREVGAILEDAPSWEELHAQLAEHDARIERKGSGAILLFRGGVLKLSTVSRKASLSKLEARLGPWDDEAARSSAQEAQMDVRSSADRPQMDGAAGGEDVRKDDEGREIAGRTDGEGDAIPVDGVRKDARLVVSWERYREERAAYLAAKARAQEELKARHRAQFVEMKERQRNERRGMWREDRRAGWRELAMLRSLYAYAHRVELLDLRDGQREERAELRSRHLMRFPSYKRWVMDQGDEALALAYRYPGQSVIRPDTPEPSTKSEPRPADLRDYVARRGAGHSVLYHRKGSRVADFKDTGRLIVMDDARLDETSVTAALQLAEQRWGAVWIDGTDEYKELCVRVAAKHGLRLANEDLAAEVERRRREERASEQTPTRETKEAPPPAARPEAREAHAPTEEEIRALGLVGDPIIHLRPRTDGQTYKGEVVHVDADKGFVVQRTGPRGLFVHRCEKLESVLSVGEDVRIKYPKDQEGKATVERVETRKRSRSRRC